MVTGRFGQLLWARSIAGTVAKSPDEPAAAMICLLVLRNLFIALLQVECWVQTWSFWPAKTLRAGLTVR
ncbi:MAG: hypothetical protein EBY76_05650 [Betaproteobacteria bacterium]|nr:hypothetical protein [Betaproteobacteria bacterium]